MAEIHQLNLPTEAARLEAFEEFWKNYPHHPTRSKKPASRELFMRITAPGGTDTRTKNDDSGGFIEIHLEATAQEIVDGCKAFWKSLPAKSQTDYKRDTTYVPGAQVWLNSGRWEQ